MLLIVLQSLQSLMRLDHPRPETYPHSDGLMIVIWNSSLRFLLSRFSFSSYETFLNQLVHELESRVVASVLHLTTKATHVVEVLRSRRLPPHSAG